MYAAYDRQVTFEDPDELAPHRCALYPYCKAKFFTEEGLRDHLKYEHRTIKR